MNFTFGIITAPGNEDRIVSIINSIDRNKIDGMHNEFEVIVIGNIAIEDLNVTNYMKSKVRIFQFNENVKKAWITKKKNIITQNASFENIVYMHDYFYFSDDWYENMLAFGDDWEILTNKQVNLDGSRFRDWCLWPGEKNGENPYAENKTKCLLPYDIKHLTKHMYLSGGYWIAKKYVMEQFPLDESLTWGQGEDVLWSKQVRQKYTFKINENAVVHLAKQKHQHFMPVSNEYVAKIDSTLQHKRK